MEKPPPLTITDIDFLCLFFLGSGGGLGDWGDVCGDRWCVGDGVVVGDGRATKCGVLSLIISFLLCGWCGISGGEGDSEGDGVVLVWNELGVCVDEFASVGVLFALFNVTNAILALLLWE